MLRYNNIVPTRETLCLPPQKKLFSVVCSGALGTADMATIIRMKYEQASGLLIRGVVDSIEFEFRYCLCSSLSAHIIIQFKDGWIMITAQAGPIIATLKNMTINKHDKDKYTKGDV